MPTIAYYHKLINKHGLPYAFAIVVNDVMKAQIGLLLSTEGDTLNVEVVRKRTSAFDMYEGLNEDACVEAQMDIAELCDTVERLRILVDVFSELCTPTLEEAQIELDKVKPAEISEERLQSIIDLVKKRKPRQ